MVLTNQDHHKERYCLLLISPQLSTQWITLSCCETFKFVTYQTLQKRWITSYLQGRATFVEF